MRADLMIAGSYTSERDGRGIYLYDFDPCGGKLREFFTDSQNRNPSFLAGRGDVLVAVNEVEAESELSLYRVEQGGRSLRLTDRLPVPGAALCHIHMWRESDYFTVAGYSSGSFLLCRVEGEKLRLIREVIPGEDFAGEGFGDRVSHVHSTIVTPDGRYLLAADLGLDRVFCYEISESEQVLTKPREGSRNLVFGRGEGPRHTAFSPDGRYYYVLTELKSHVFVFQVNEDGRMEQIQWKSTLPEGYQGEAAGADIHISEDGAYLYVSNRGPNTVAVFRRNREEGTLELLRQAQSGGNWPRNFCLAPSQNHILVANERSGKLVVYERDPQTGELGRKTDEVEAEGVSFISPFYGEGQSR